ncbi:MAG: ABC transporter permease [Spirochaetaceae bacterium]|nr:ABC transporter permease [Spirochaetaceae bacterium]MCF7950828.1 ABC transporter permease [Spirochaetaceae bacterium]
MQSEFLQKLTIFRKNRLAMVALFVAILLVVLALFASFISPYDPVSTDLENKLLPGFWAGNWDHPLGTDNLGRDLLSRILHGGAISLRVGYMVIAVTAFFGTLLGIVSAYYGGVVDILIMRVIDVFLSFPPLLLALAIAASLGAGLENAMFAISLVYIPQMARVVRGSVLKVKTNSFIEASRALAGGNMWIMGRHILPNIFPSALVYLTLLLADAILYTASLGFLGIGIKPSTPEWGAMLSSGKEYLLMGQWWVTVFPGIMIVLAVLSFNLVGDGLREAFDSKLKR